MFAGVILLFPALPPTLAQPLCDGSLISVGYGSFHRIEINKDKQSFTVDPFLNLDRASDVIYADAVGYRWKDQSFYGAIRRWAQDSIPIFSVSAEGVYQVLGYIKTGNSFDVLSGAFSQDQRYLFLVENR